MKYNIGDQIKVKEGLKATESYGGLFFHPDMVKYCGTTQTIIMINSENKYIVDSDAWCFTDEMFEGFIEKGEELTKLSLLKIAAILMASSQNPYNSHEHENRANWALEEVNALVSIIYKSEQ